MNLDALIVFLLGVMLCFSLYYDTKKEVYPLRYEVTLLSGENFLCRSARLSRGENLILNKCDGRKKYELKNFLIENSCLFDCPPNQDREACVEECLIQEPQDQDKLTVKIKEIANF